VGLMARMMELDMAPEPVPASTTTCPVVHTRSIHRGLSTPASEAQRELCATHLA
jgi:hypothetical protein